MVEIVDKVLVSTQSWEDTLYDSNRPLTELIFELAERSYESEPDRVWLTNGITGQTIKTRDLKPFTHKVAAVFQKKGLAQGDLVTIISNNDILYHIPVFAAWLCGAAVNLLDPWVDQARIEEQLRIVNSKIIVCIPEVLDKVKESLTNLKQSAAQIFLYRESNSVADCDPDMIVEAIVKKEVDLNTFVPCLAFNKEDLAVIFWSSGSTGKSKGIQVPVKTITNWMSITQSHPAIPFKIVNYMNKFWMVRKLIQSLVRLMYNNPMALGTWMFHMGGFVFSFLLMFVQSVVFFQPDKINPTLMLETMSKYQCSSGMFSYHDIIRLSNEEKSRFSYLDLTQVKVMFTVGAQLPPNTLEKLQKILTSLRMLPNPYGATETGGGITFSMSQEKGGTLYPYTKVKVVNCETGEKCGPNEEGEIHVKNRSMLIGYLNAEMTNVFDEEGFFKMGDVGYYDSHGLLYFVDRLKDLIKVGLHHVYPTEVEKIIEAHPDVAAVGVFAVPDLVYGESCAAVVELKSGSIIDGDTLLKWTNEQTEKWKQLSKLKIVEKLPVNNIGKRARIKMKELL